MTFFILEAFVSHINNSSAVHLNLLVAVYMKQTRVK